MLISVTLLQPGMKVDEWLHHLPTLFSIIQEGLFDTIKSENYLAANTPLPYLITYIFYEIFELRPDLTALRIGNSIVSFITISLVYKYFSKIRIKYLLSAVLLLIFYPYFIKPSFTYYMSIYGLLFFVAALLVLHYSKNEVKWLYAGIMLGLAVSAQQFYLAVAPLMFLYSTLEEKELKPSKQIFRASMLFVPSILLLLPVYLVWGGLTPEKYSFHDIAFDPANLTSILVICGGLFVPYIIHELRKINIKWIIPAAVVSIILLAFADPVWAELGGDGKITGYTFHSIELTNYLIPNFEYIIKFLLIVISLVSFKLIFNNSKDNIDLLLMILFFGFIAAFTFNEFLSERHLLPLVFVLYTLVLRKMDEKYIIYPWAALQIFFGSAYFYYYLYIQNSF